VYRKFLSKSTTFGLMCDSVNTTQNAVCWSNLWDVDDKSAEKQALIGESEMLDHING
jgi:hypothetical protein